MRHVIFDQFDKWQMTTSNISYVTMCDISNVVCDNVWHVKSDKCVTLVQQWSPAQNHLGLFSKQDQSETSDARNLQRTIFLQVIVWQSVKRFLCAKWPDWPNSCSVEIILQTGASDSVSRQRADNAVLQGTTDASQAPNWWCQESVDFQFSVLTSESEI